MNRRESALRWCATVLVLVGAPLGAWSPSEGAATVVTLSAQITPIDDEAPVDPVEPGNIIGSPDAGPDPQDAGDRGGSAQLGLALVLIAAVGFILRKVIREAGAGSDTS